MIEKKRVYKFKISRMNSRKKFGCKVTYHTRKQIEKVTKKSP